ncbi:MAG: isocitrate/isopropylmalate family dehydrogenase [Methanobacteriaceae archaeon]|nr:isocitrate/isopropylmalate family dehydrogenase [Methanobacteriaceae archaeon]
MYNITVIPGDGIGKEVMDATITILRKTGIKFNFTYAKAGDDCKKETGTALPEETITLIKESDACLFGAVGETAADVIVKLRRELDTYVNVRPIKTIQNVENPIDFTIIRENTEGLYIGEEQITTDGAIATRRITKKASKRICEYAFEYAKKLGKNKVTAAHKANVLKVTDGLFKEIFYETASQYPTIETEDYYIDATAMYLITNPTDFQVIVTTNLYGDILSDEGAGLVGGLGMIPSANIGENNGLFEPVHGSAPDIAGKQIANPTAMILSACMMLNYLEEYETAKNIEEIVIKTIQEEKIITPDINGTASTQEMAEYIASQLRKN